MSGRATGRVPVLVLVLALGTVGCTGTAGTGSAGAGRSTAPPSGTVLDGASRTSPTPSATPGGCGSTPLLVGAKPEWTQSGTPPALPYVLSHEGNLVGVPFTQPLRAQPPSGGPNNKILWIVREPRNGSDLRLTLRPVDGTNPAVTVTQPANSWPGEIYPSIVDVPAAGCWTVVGEWDGHRATLELAYT